MESTPRQTRHDILGCLNAISLSLQVLKISDDPDEMAGYIKMMEEQVVLAVKLLREMPMPAVV